MEDQQKDTNTVDNVEGINIPPVLTTTSGDDKDQIIASLKTVKQSNITPASDAVENIETSEAPIEENSSKSNSNDEAANDFVSSAPIEETSSNSNDEADNDSVSSDITDVAIANIEEQNQFDEDINAAPMHLHALRIKDARLKGLPRHNSDGKLLDSSDKHGRRSRSTSRSRPGGGSMRSVASSRSSSPLPSTGGGSRYTSDVQHAASVAAASIGESKAGSSSRGGGNKPAAGDASTIGGYSTAHSAVSSMDGNFIDPDVLLDRLGFIDLDPPLPHEIRCGPLANPGSVDGKSNIVGLTPVNERLSEETLDDCHAFNDLVMIDNLKHVSGGMSTMSMPSVAHSSLSGVRSDMSVGSLSVGSFGKGTHSRGGGASVAGGSLMGDGENSVLLGTLDEEGEDAIDEESATSQNIEEQAAVEIVEGGD